ncbi:MAG: hypothetical protein EA352_07760 [Gemmatimonadales bacterium]|nr:MAG: hypothetical protein EA352_07760 [Gemmatimonadales bacterium]
MADPDRPPESGLFPLESLPAHVSRSLPSTVSTLGPLLAVAAILLFLPACSTAPAAQAGPAVDAGELTRTAQQASRLDRPYRLVFEWSVNEPDLRASGMGVARVEPPYRARLDLFSANGDRILVAALVDDDVRIPEGLPATVPPGPLLWGVLGILRPGPGFQPSGGEGSPSNPSRIAFRVAGGGEMDVRLSSGRIERMELRSVTGGREDVRLQFGEGERFPRQAIYRHHGEVRELRLNLEEVEQVEVFPSDIWSPGR